MKHDRKGHRMSNLTDGQLIDAVGACEDKSEDKSASDIAHHMGGYDRSTVSRHLKELERDGMVTHREVRGAGGMLALWSLTGKKRCSECNTFLDYTGTEWACPTCHKDKFDDCFTKFDTKSEKCKTCCSAVECYEASQ